MRKVLLFVLLLIIFIPINYYATSGALSIDSIKTCPNGKLYGHHSNHWHRAVKKGDRYYASGSAIKSDPCPPKSDNNELASVTIDGDKISVYYHMTYETYKKDIKIKAVPSDSKAKVSVGYKGLTIGKNTIPIIVTAQNGEKEEYELVVTLLEANISLETLKINGSIIEISNDMVYETYNKDIVIEAIAHEDNVKVSNNYKELSQGDNKITITLTDIYGNTKNYNINIILKKRDLTLKSLKIDNNEIELSNNMTYETYNKNIYIEAIPNDEKVIINNNYENLVLGNNKILITLSDEFNNKKEYVLTVILKERTITLDYLTINDDIIEISNNMVYETYGDNIYIDARSNYEDVKVTNDYEYLRDGNNYITITLSDNYGNSEEYVLNVIKKTIKKETKESIEEETTYTSKDNDTTREVVGGLARLTIVGGVAYAAIKKKRNKSK